MKSSEHKKALTCAVEAARAAGKMMSDNLRSTKKINEATLHDIKLELDVRCQKRIEATLRRAFPTVAILGEEGIVGDPESDARWVVDPIDGTVNFFYGIPHACVSIALQVRLDSGAFQTVVGVVFDPFCDELWTAIRGQPARLNGKPIRVSERAKLGEAIVALGFAKQKFTLDLMLPTFNGLIHRVRKVRIMGAAALSMVYVASGRMDAYVEYGLRLWDIAAGGLILECAGGEHWNEPVAGEYAYQIVANNGRLRKQIEAVARSSKLKRRSGKA